MSRQSMADDIFEQLGQPPSGSHAERRRHPRRPLSVSTEAMIDLCGERHWISITLQDISPGGVGFIGRRLFYAGEFLVVRLDFPGSRQGPKHVLCQVRSCRYGGSQLYHTGVEFKEAVAATQRRDYLPEAWFQLLQAAKTTKTRT